MYGSNEFNIQVIFVKDIYERIQFKLMMNKIIEPDFNKILNTFPGLTTILKCTSYRIKKKLVVKIEYKFNNEIIFCDSIYLSEL